MVSSAMLESVNKNGSTGVIWAGVRFPAGANPFGVKNWRYYEKMSKKDKIIINGTLSFYDCYRNVILEGIKTSTIRRKCKLKKGDVVSLIFDRRAFNIFLKITNVSIITLKDIDNDIARSEAFMHADLLKEEIKRIYQVKDESELFYRIEFKLCD